MANKYVQELVSLLCALGVRAVSFRHSLKALAADIPHNQVKANLCQSGSVTVTSAQITDETQSHTCALFQAQASAMHPSHTPVHQATSSQSMPAALTCCTMHCASQTQHDQVDGLGQTTQEDATPLGFSVLCVLP